MSEPHCVLVSGGSRGLGLGIVESLLQDGQNVATFSRRETADMRQLEEAYPDQFMFVTGDMERPDLFPKLVQTVERKFGRLSALVNNAGIVNEELLARQKADAIEQLLAVNLLGPVLLTRQAIRGMMVAGRGRVVNISSIVSLSGYKGTAAYSATKGGINAMTRALARELGGRGITVNTVAPGYMETDLVKNMSLRHLAQIERRTPLGRSGKVEDVVGLVKFLLSEEAAFISGQTIVVDGGLTA
ncbi:MAG: SDR family oxidoreductase [Hyphomicrobiaceae bacterium]|nr:SDR family oxidoreductase [Hyphomicrobiaceae bacterium]